MPAKTIFSTCKLKELVLPYLLIHSPTVAAKIFCFDDCSVKNSLYSRLYIKLFQSATLWAKWHKVGVPSGCEVQLFASWIFKGTDSSQAHQPLPWYNLCCTSKARYSQLLCLIPLYIQYGNSFLEHPSSKKTIQFSHHKHVSNEQFCWGDLMKTSFSNSWNYSFLANIKIILRTTWF